MTLDLMLGFVSGVLHPAQGCKILVYKSSNILCVQAPGGGACNTQNYYNIEI